MQTFYTNAIIHAYSYDLLYKVWDCAAKCKHVDLIVLGEVMHAKLNRCAPKSG